MTDGHATLNTPDLLMTLTQKLERTPTVDE